MSSSILTYALIGLGAVCFGLGVTVWWQSGTIDRLEAQNVLLGANVLTLEGAVETQNQKTRDFAALVNVTIKSSQEALRAALAGRSDRDATIADLLARPLETNPERACLAADTLILEFYP